MSSHIDPLRGNPLLSYDTKKGDEVIEIKNETDIAGMLSSIDGVIDNNQTNVECTDNSIRHGISLGDNVDKIHKPDTSDLLTNYFRIRHYSPNSYNLERGTNDTLSEEFLVIEGHDVDIHTFRLRIEPSDGYQKLTKNHRRDVIASLTSSLKKQIQNELDTRGHMSPILVLGNMIYTTLSNASAISAEHIYLLQGSDPKSYKMYVDPLENIPVISDKNSTETLFERKGIKSVSLLNKGKLAVYQHLENLMTKDLQKVRNGNTRLYFREKGIESTRDRSPPVDVKLCSPLLCSSMKKEYSPNTQRSFDRPSDSRSGSYPHNSQPVGMHHFDCIHSKEVPSNSHNSSLIIEGFSLSVVKIPTEGYHFRVDIFHRAVQKRDILSTMCSLIDEEVSGIFEHGESLSSKSPVKSQCPVNEIQRKFAYDPPNIEPTQFRTVTFSTEWKRRCENAIIFASPNHRIYRVQKVRDDMTPYSTFEFKDKKSGVTSQKTFADFVKEKYDRDVTVADQPMLQCAGEKKTETVFIIPELAALTGLTDDIRRDRQLMQEVLDISRIDTAQRFEAGKNTIRQLMNNPLVRGFAEEWCITVDDNPLRVPASLIPNPIVSFEPEKMHIVENGLFQRLTRNGSRCPIHINKWLLIYPEPDFPYLEVWMRSMKEISHHGFNSFIGPPELISCTYQIRDLRNVLLERIHVDTQLVLLITGARESKWTYQIFKQVTSLERPCISQVVKSETLRKRTSIVAIVTRVVMQISAKFLGPLWHIKIDHPIKRMTKGFPSQDKEKDIIRIPVDNEDPQMIDGMSVASNTIKEHIDSHNSIDYEHQNDYSDSVEKRSTATHTREPSTYPPSGLKEDVKLVEPSHRFVYPHNKNTLFTQSITQESDKVSNGKPIEERNTHNCVMLLDTPTMVIGVFLSIGTDAINPVLGVVASLNRPFTYFFSKCRILNRNVHETGIGDLDSFDDIRVGSSILGGVLRELFVECFYEFADNNDGVLPGRVIVYRAGTHSFPGKPRKGVLIEIENLKEAIAAIRARSMVGDTGISTVKEYEVSVTSKFKNEEDEIEKTKSNECMIQNSNLQKCNYSMETEIEKVLYAEDMIINSSDENNLICTSHSKLNIDQQNQVKKGGASSVDILRDICSRVSSPRMRDNDEYKPGITYILCASHVATRFFSTENITKIYSSKGYNNSDINRGIKEDNFRAPYQNELRGMRKSTNKDICSIKGFPSKGSIIRDNLCSSRSEEISDFYFNHVSNPQPGTIVSGEHFSIHDTMDPLLRSDCHIPRQGLSGDGDRNIEGRLSGIELDYVSNNRKSNTFFLVNQHVSRGTASPSQYTVIYDTEYLGIETYQNITSKLAFLYFNFPGGVRLPAPVQYAKKLCSFVSGNLFKEPHKRLKNTLFYL